MMKRSKRRRYAHAAEQAPEPSGARPGYVFKKGAQGLGYYKDGPLGAAPPAGVTALGERFDIELYSDFAAK